MDKSLEGYIACLCKFEGEDNEAALGRVFAYYKPDTHPVVDVVAQYAYEGLALTPRMLADKTGVVVDQTGLTPQSIELYTDMLGESERQRKIHAIGELLVKTGDFVSAQNSLMELGELQHDSGAVLGMQEHLLLGEQLFTQRQEMIRSGAAFVRFPWNKLNEMLPYIYSDDLILLSGDSKVGKSSAAHQIALRNARQLPVLYFHNEDNILKLHMRRLAQMQIEFDRELAGSSISYADLVRNTIKGPNFLEVIKRTNELVLEQIGDRLTYVYCSGWTPERIVTEWRKQRRQKGIGLVIIDYLNKIEMSHLIKSRNNVAYAIDYTVELFKREAGLAQQQTPCILVQQENEDGSVRDGRSSYIKAQAHISLQRTPTGDIIELMRANDGEPGQIMAKFFPKYMLWVA
ncbi:MAG: DnaB helicase C-terminal domain-containing protein [Sphaerochaeta sp.]|jgi:hypothetical protein|nr:DnaB helicase C-terminal domain-containing protein [Sphaerochaeta sp.]